MNEDINVGARNKTGVFFPIFKVNESRYDTVLSHTLYFLVFC